MSIMGDFNYINGSLHAEFVSLEAVADTVGTPYYIYSANTIHRNYQMFESALKGLKYSISYSVKANSNIAILKLLSDLGAGMDIVSSGEYLRARRAGVAANKIVFSGVGKTEDELIMAINGGIKQINIESEPELKLLNLLAKRYNKIIPISVRVNPDINALTHDKITTGRLEDKFGIPYKEVVPFCSKLKKFSNVRLSGLAIHIGSQLTDVEPFRKAFTKISELVRELRTQGHEIFTLDLGGGIGIPYSDYQDTINLKIYADLVRDTLGNLGCEFEFEPGRVIVGNAGVLVSSVIYRKQAEKRNFLIIDGAMNDLIRPAMYDAHHDIIPIKQGNKSPRITVDIVGPICETSDTFARGREFPLTSNGALVAILSCGAYGAVMSSEYNSRPLIPEVLVREDKFTIIRARQDINDILNRDIVPEWLAQKK